VPNIKITVAGKIATNTTPDVVIVCGNSDYTVTFDLDAEWAVETTRTARFSYIRDGRTRYKEKTFQGNTVAVPKLSAIRQVTVGLYAGTPDDPGDLRTTTAAAVWCKPSILCGDAAEEITPEEKAGLQSQVDELRRDVDTLKEGGTGGNTGGNSSNSGQNVEPAEDDIPKVFINGTIPTTKDDVLAEMQYISKTENFSAYITIKCQGSSSMQYAKKNFTIKMYSDEARETTLKKVFKDWGHESHKYVLKANWIDHSHARNIVSARLWHEVVSSRADYATLPDEMRNSPRNGAIDGFPIKVYTNGTYQGIYTWNIGKDDWMWGMTEDNPNHVLLCAEVNNNGEDVDTAANFRALWAGEHEYDWAVEVGKKTTSITSSLNALISCVKDTDDTTFKATVGNYLDVQSAIDYWIHQYIICGLDGLGKNLLLATYDGVTWICGAYDMDGTFGLHYSGELFVATDFKCPEDYQETRSLLWERLANLYSEEIVERYIQLRSTVYSVSNMVTKFERFMDVIGSDLYVEDLEIYTEIPSGNTNNIKQIRNFIRDRLYYCDLMLNPPDGPLYPLANGQYEWTVGSAPAPNMFLNITNGCHVRLHSVGEIATSAFVAIGDFTTNTAVVRLEKNIDGTTTRFSINPGDNLRIVIRHTADSSRNNPYSIYFSRYGSGLFTVLRDVTGDVDTTVQVDELLDVTNIGMYSYYWADNANAVFAMEFDIEIYVNDTRYV
jgi:hypothetical protein